MEDWKRDKAKADWDKPAEEHNSGGWRQTNHKELTQPWANEPFQTVTEGAPVQVRKYQIERRIFQVNPWKIFEIIEKA